MDVLFVASWFPSVLHRKNGNFIEQHARAVALAGCNVKVVHLAYSNRILMPRIGEENRDGISIYHLFIPKRARKSKLVKKRLFKKLISKLHALAFEPQIIHGHVVFPAGELALSLSRHYSAPLIYTEHWSGYKAVNAHRYTREVQMLTETVLKHVDLILPVSFALGESMRAKGLMGNYDVVNNAVDTSVFHPKERDKNRKTEFLHVSNFDPRAKNTEGIIRAFVRGNFENATLTIAGDGDLPALRTFLKSLKGDTSSVRLFGSLDYKEVAQLMQNSDCFVMFSNFENLPCVIAEAHCCGLPVLATSVGGIPEMIDDTNGRTIVAGDEEQLISGMNYFIENGSRFNKFEIAATAANRYSYSAIGEQFLNYYKQISTHR